MEVCRAICFCIDRAATQHPFCWSLGPINISIKSAHRQSHCLQFYYLLQFVVLTQYRPLRGGFSTRIKQKTPAKSAFRYPRIAGPESFSRTACFSSSTWVQSRGPASKNALVFSGFSEFKPSSYLAAVLFCLIEPRAQGYVFDTHRPSRQVVRASSFNRSRSTRSRACWAEEPRS